MKRSTRLLVMPAAAVAAALVLAACGDGDDDSGHDMGAMTPPPASAPAGPGTAPAAAFNEADVMFAQMMIPHHEQAVEMAREAPAKAASPEVRQLAARIEAAQGPEIAQMKAWLTAWGRPAAAPGGMHHGEGMMSAEEMNRFRAASGAEFDRLFLTMMIAHHNGAIAMAGTELAGGVNPDARALAQRIKDSQAAEVAEMTRMLGGRSASPAPMAPHH